MTSSSVKIKAVILAAGRGSRLLPLTASIPKPLIEVNGRAILARSLDCLAAQDIHHLVVVTGYREAMLRRFFALHYPDLSIEYIYNPIFQESNTAYSLWLTREAFHPDELMLLLDGDIVYEEAVLQAMLALPKAESFIAAKLVERMGHEEMKVIVDEQHTILAISKDLDPRQSLFESFGMALFSPSTVMAIFDRLGQRMNASLEAVRTEYCEATYQDLIDHDQVTIKIFDVGACYCMEIDTIDDLEVARNEVLPFIDNPP